MILADVSSSSSSSCGVIVGKTFGSAGSPLVMACWLSISYIKARFDFY
jgi:hypothetical protein